MPLNDKVDYGLTRNVSLQSDVGFINNDLDVPTIPAAVATTVVGVNYGTGILNRTTLTCTAVPIVTADEAGQGQYGGVQVLTMPAGLITTLGAVIDGSVTLTEAAWTDTWIGDIGIGIITPADQQNGLTTVGSAAILQSTSTTIAVAQVGNVDAVSIATALTEAGSRIIDGTTTAVPVWLNLLVDDAAAHVDGHAGTFTGTIEILWAKIGDN